MEKAGQNFAKFVDDLIEKYKKSKENDDLNLRNLERQQIPRKKPLNSNINYTNYNYDDDYNEVKKRNREQTMKKIAELEQFFNIIMEENTKLKLKISKLELEIQQNSYGTFYNNKNNVDDSQSDLFDTIHRLEIENTYLRTTNKKLKDEIHFLQYNNYSNDLSSEEPKNIGLEIQNSKLQQLNSLFIRFFGKFDKKFYEYINEFDIESIKRFLISMNKRFVGSRSVSPIKSRNPSASPPKSYLENTNSTLNLTSTIGTSKDKSNLNTLDERMSKIEKGLNFLILEQRKKINNNIKPISKCGSQGNLMLKNYNKKYK